MALVILFVIGTVGVGKTSVGAAASDILSEREIPHAFVDRDALCASWPPVERFNEATALRNLALVWTTYREQGIDRLIVAGVLETREDVRRYEDALGEPIMICRLAAPLPARQAWLRARDEGGSLDWHLARTVELEAIVEAAALEDFVVHNDGRTRRDVALDMLRTAGWVSGSRTDDATL